MSFIHKQPQNDKRSIDPTSSDIAIIGMACRLPDANHYYEFWDNLVLGINSIREVPKDRWNPDIYYSSDMNQENKSRSKWCSCIERFEYFDHQFFNISPREALTMDPHQRQMLEVAWQCVEDAGISLNRLQKNNTAVYMTAPNPDYVQRAFSLDQNIDSYTNLGNYSSLIANRISFSLGLTGGSTAVDAACASALVAVHEGKKALLSGEGDYVLVGSGNLIMHPGRYISYSKARMLSPNGQCKTFDESADGFVPGEGIGVVLLQRLEDAVRDRHHIYAVIKGSSVNHIGQQVSITAPRVGVQADLISSAYQDAGFSPGTVGYIETHGSATALGDPIEMEALTKVFRAVTDKQQICQVGSVKSNIGHLESASGMAGLIKTLLMLKNRKIPKTLNLKKWNPLIPFATSPFRPAEELCDWKPVQEDLPLRAGISAFGFGGVSAHVLLEEYSDEANPDEANPDEAHNSPLPFLLSAKHPASLNMLIGKWKEFVRTEHFAEMNIRDICGTVMVSRSGLPYRYGYTVASKEELQEKLNESMEEAVKGEFEAFNLLLGDLKLEGYKDFSSIYETYPIFRAYADRFKTVISKDAWGGLFAGIWQPADIKLNTFIVYDAFVRSLMSSGVKVDSLLSGGAGVWVALGISRILTDSQIVDCLSGKLSYDSLSLSRPVIPLHDPVSKEMIVPYKVRGSYIFNLLMGARVEWADITRYLQKARDLYSQLTFKKLLEEWNGPLAEINQNVESLLYAPDQKGSANRKPLKEQLLLMMIVITSIRRLNQKWELQDGTLGGSKQFHELLALVLDQVITKETLVQLLGSRQRDLEMIAGKLNGRLHYMDCSKPYTLLKKDNRYLLEIPDFSKWIKRAETAGPAPIGHKDKQGCLQIGSLSGYTNTDVDIKVSGDNLETMLLDALYGLWIKGSPVYWTAYYPEDSFHKVALPVYEFTGKPFLLPLSHPEAVMESPTFTNEAVSGSPASDVKSFSLKDSLIQDHVITGKHLIPAAAMIAFALARFKADNKATDILLQNTVIQNPGIVEDEKNVQFRRIKDNRFELLTDVTVICKGKYEMAAASPPSPLNVEGIDGYSSMPLDGLYAFLFGMGYQYGESLQVIKAIRTMEQGYIIQLGENHPDAANPHSSELLDGIIQSVLVVEYVEGRLRQNHSLFIPYMIKTIRVLSELRGACYVVINTNDIQRKHGHLLARLSVYDMNGKPVLMMEELQLQSCPDTFLQKPESGNKQLTREKEQLFSYRPVWTNSVLPGRPLRKLQKNAVIFMDGGISHELADKLGNGYEHQCYVVKGEGFSVKDHIITVNPLSQDDYTSLIAYLGSWNRHADLEHDIYYLWTYGSEEAVLHSMELLERIEDVHIRSLFHLCKALISARFPHRTNLLVTVQDCFVVQAGDKGAGYMYGGLAGFFKTVMQEYSRLQIHLLDLPAYGLTIEEKAQIIFAEQSKPEKGEVVAYRQNRRFAESLEAINVTGDTGGAVWMEGHTYLVVGGMGGIGFHIVESMCRSVRAHVIVLGSSGLDDSRAAKLQQLNQYQATVEYAQCDINDRNALSERIRMIKSAYRHIHGVIHCGGINRDQLLINKDWSTFKDVLAPKSRGTYLLNQLTRHDPLEFFLVCSSIVSRIGNIGQADYAAANGFVDAFSDYRRLHSYPGKSICLNWTLWKDTGMGHNDKAANLFSHKTGVISSSAGIEHLLRILTGPGDSCMVVADQAVFEDFLSKNHRRVEAGKEGFGGEGPAIPAAMHVTEAVALVRELSALLAQLLDVEAGDVDERTDVREFGLDSVSLNEFAEMINDRLGTDINSTLLFEYSTVKEISEYVMKQYADSFQLSAAGSEGVALKEENQVNSSMPIASEGRIGKELEGRLTALLSGLLGVQENEVDGRTDLRDLGLDSVSLNEFAEMINDEWGLDINSTLLFEYSTIKEISSYLSKEYGSLLPSLSRGLEEAYAEASADLEAAVTGERPIEVRLGSLLSALIGVRENEIDARTDVRDFGLDSISLNEFADMINDEFAVDMNSTLLFEYSTLQEIAAYLQSEYAVSPGQMGQPELHQVSAPAPKASHQTGIREPERRNPLDRSQVKEAPRNEDIAIIGISGRMPQADNVHEFWENLINQADAITEIPLDRWDWTDYHGDPQKEENKSNNKWGGFLKDIRRFDSKFFNLSPREAELMDPQQRILLEEVWRVFEDSGYSPMSLSGSNTGVFIGVGNSDYNQLISESDVNMDSYTATGTYFSIVANRISYVFNLHGPSTIVDTACSSSLVAIHQAVQSIQNKECTMAVAGGVNIICAPRPYLAFSHAGMLSPDGRCKTFDKDANGYVRAEGAGVVLLKPLKAAINDGDQIYGIIKGTAVNHNGFTNSLTAPNPNAQADVIIRAFEKGSIDPGTVSYIETHGTGTSLGDPIEINGLKKAFGEMSGQLNKKLAAAYCGLGAVKTNVGHLEYSAGIIGLIKVLLSMKHRIIPGNLHFSEMNPYIKLDSSPFYVIRSNRQWEALTDGKGNALPRRAGVSSFGFGGANAHVVLEEYIPAREAAGPADAPLQSPTIIVLSAKNEDRLLASGRLLYDFIEKEGVSDRQLVNIAYTLQTGRETMQERLAIVADSVHELKELLRSFLDGKGTGPNIFHGNTKGFKDTISILERDQAFEDTLGQWIAYRNYHKLLSLWVKGLSVDWNLLYGASRPGRLSLPTYPFAEDRYWLPLKVHPERVGKGKNLDAAAAVLHPLLHQNSSNLKEQRYSTTFTGTEFFLKDHVIGDKKILPGVAYLEMARAAFAAWAGGIADNQAVVIKHMVWSRPIMAEELAIEVHTGIYPETGDGVSLSIYSTPQAEENARIVHGQCTASLSAIQEAPVIDLMALQQRCTKRRLSAEACYSIYESMGIHYGPAHQGVQEIRLGEGEVLARLSLPEAAREMKDSFMLHPSILDSALQATVGLLAGEDGTAPAKPLLPFTLEEVIVYGACNSSLWARVRYSSLAGESGRVHNSGVRPFDIQLFDDQGQVKVIMNGYSARVLEESSSTGVLLLEPVWNERKAEGTGSQPEYEEHYVIFSGLTPHVGLEISQRGLDSTAAQVRYLVLDAAGETPGETFTHDALELFGILQRLLKQGIKKKFLVQVIHARQGTTWMHAGLAGMLRTASKENSKFVWQMVEIDGNETPEEIIICLEENSRYPGNHDIRYRDGSPAVLGWKETESVRVQPAGMPWKEHGVYLITGGTGGLGMIFAREIAAQAKGATLILTGRSPLDADKTHMLQSLMNVAAVVDYRPVDVCQKEAVSGLMEDILSKYGQLNGIIHCAGVMQDNYLLNKTSEEFKAVLDPKVAGLMHLDEGSKAMKLDMFVAFSSIAGSLGNPGQADYAAANAFMDAYCAYRNQLVAGKQRHGRSLSINWPLWQEGGMQVDASTKELLLRSLGIVPLDTAKGLQAYYQGLSSEADQLMILEGNVRQIRQKLNLISSPSSGQVMATGQAAAEKVTGRTSGTKVIRQIRLSLSTLIAKLMRFDLEDLDIHVELKEYGFDSISFTELANRINQQFELNLMPTVLFEYPTIHSLAQYLLSEYAEAFADANEEDGQLHTQTELEAGQAYQTPEFGEASLAEAMDEVVEEPVPGSEPSRFAVPGEAPKRHIQEPVAVIGMSGELPMAKDMSAFWENLKDEKHCITEVPKSRWDWEKYFGDPAKDGNKTHIKWGGFLDAVDEFDPLFFGISPREAELMDPQQRLIMTYVWKAIEDAGYSAKSLSGSKTGIFVGTIDSGYNGLLNTSHVELQGYSSTGIVPSVGPNRMSYFLNIHGPSEPIETACSSSLVAIHRAVHALENGDCDTAIVGGVNTIITPEKHISFDKAGMLCGDGRCKTFSDEANGYVRGEGAVMMVLKKLTDAEAAGDHIYGLIRGTAENHGGRASSLTAPNSRAQADVIIEACMRSGLDPRTITYVEAHGTGTKLGDPLEVNGLKTAFRELYQLWGDDSGQAQTIKPHCGLGSVKTNIGHLELAAGAAGVAKVLLQFKHQTLVKSLHCNEINPYIQLDGSPFYIVQEREEWKPLEDAQGNILPRRAGVSSFGFGGVNSHVVIEEYIPSTPSGAEAPISNKVAVVLSARDEIRLGEQVAELLSAIRQRPVTDHELQDVAYTLQVGREAMKERLAVTAVTVKELEEKLELYLAAGTGDIPGLYRGQQIQKRTNMMDDSDDEEMQNDVAAWMAERKYSKLLDLWVQGLELDWSMLYRPAEHRRRISLPTYPFARERYWVPEPSPASTGLDFGSKPVNSGDFLHPLLHKNVSSFRKQKYQSRFSGEEFFLKAHVIHGKRVLPGVAYMEMALQAVRSSLGIEKEAVQCIRLKSMDWTRPLAVAFSPAQAEIELSFDDNGDIQYKIYDQDQQSAIYSTGKTEVKELEAEEPERIDIGKKLDQCDKRVYTAEECYAAFAAMGFQYGDEHKGLERLYVGENQLLAKLTLPGSVRHTQADYLLHPSLLDAAIQATVGFMMEESEMKVLVPFTLEELRLLHHQPSPAWAVIRPGQGRKLGNGMRKLDIDLCDEKGQLCIQLKGLTVKEWKESPKSKSRSELMIWTPDWEDREAEPAAKVFYDQRLILLCGTEPVDQTALIAKMNGIAKQNNCLTLSSGDQSIQMSYKEHALQVFEALKQLLAAASVGGALVQLLAVGEGEAGLVAGLRGLLKTAEQENPHVQAQIIQLDHPASPNLIMDVLMENAQNPQDKEIRYTHGRRSVKRWRECPAEGELEKTLWRDHGVYLITGGAGGLGERFASEIVHQVQSPTIVISGRSYPGEDKMRKWKAMEQQGATVVFKPVDVTARAEVNKLIQELKEQYGGINGIIHGAGMHKDSYLLKKDKQTFAEVLAPKVDGLLHLDEASRGVELDWLILLSSVAGSLGNPGQADYAVANGFMDEYAAYRNTLVALGERTGRTLSINWPLWREGGMHIRPEMEAELEQRTGFVPMETRDGMTALYRAFAQNAEQVMVTAGNRERITALLGPQPPMPMSSKAEPLDKEQAVRDELYRMVCLEIIEGSMPEEEFYELLQEAFS